MVQTISLNSFKSLLEIKQASFQEIHLQSKLYKVQLGLEIQIMVPKGKALLMGH